MHLSVRDIDTCRCRDMALRSREEFYSRRKELCRSTRTKCAYHACDSKHITKANGFLYHDFVEVYITRDAVALYHDGNAVYITPP